MSQPTAMESPRDTATLCNLPAHFHSAMVLCVQTLIPTFLLIGALLWLTWVLWQSHFDNQRDMSLPHPLPDGDMGVPLIGHMIQSIHKFHLFTEKRIEKFGPIFKAHLFGQPTVIISDLQMVRNMLQSDHSPESEIRIEWPTSTRGLLGPGSLSAGGPKHKLKRKIVLAAFSHTRLSKYTPRIQEITQTFIDEWIKAGSIAALPEGTKLTFALTCDLLVGFLDQPQSERAELLHTFHEFLAGLFTLPINIPGFQYHKSLKAKDVLVRKIQACIERLASSPSEIPSIMSTLLASDDLVLSTNDDLVDSVIELMFGGYDTTSSALCSTIMFLAQNPSVVWKLRKEITEFGLDGDKSLDFRTILKMPYVNAVMLEVLAVQPPVSEGFRVARKSFKLGEYQVPKGWKVMYIVRESHRLVLGPAFAPERWLRSSVEGDDDTTNRPQRARTLSDNTNAKGFPPVQSKELLHFGYGSHSCVGKEFAKLLLRVFIIRYTESCDGTLTNEPVPMTYFPMPKPLDGMPVRLSKPKSKNM